MISDINQYEAAHEEMCLDNGWHFKPLSDKDKQDIIKKLVTLLSNEVDKICIKR